MLDCAQTTEPLALASLHEITLVLPLGRAGAFSLFNGRTDSC